MIGLRQCNSCRFSSSAAWQTSVRHECSRETGFLHLEVWSRDSAIARPSLVARIAENRIPSGGAGVPLSTWYGSIVPVIWAPARVWRRSRSGPAVYVNDGTGCAQNESVNIRRPCVSSCGHTRVEQCVAGCYPVIVAVDFQREIENWTLFALLSRHLPVLLLCRRSCCAFLFLFRDLEVLGNFMSRQCRSF